LFYIEFVESLCQELQREEQKTFAAICCLEAAKCHENLKDFIQQANLLVKAGKLFLGARESERHFEDNFGDEGGGGVAFGGGGGGPSALSGNLLVKTENIFF
jgi:hypothetical protein